MAPTRIVLGAMPALLRDIVRETLASHSDLEILAEVAERREVLAAAERTRADIAIVGVTQSDRRSVVRELLAEHRRLRIIALTSDGRFGYVYHHDLHETAIAEISPRSLIAAIRGAPATEQP